MSQQDQKYFNRYFPNRPILYQAGYAIIFESPTAAILLCQLIYWHGKGRDKDGWIYKTIVDMRKETGLTRYQQETAIRILRHHKVIEVKIASIPAKRHFRVDLQMLEEVIPSLMESHNLHYLKPPSTRRINQQTITESTERLPPKITPEITVRDLRSLGMARNHLIKRLGGNND